MLRDSHWPGFWLQILTIRFLYPASEGVNISYVLLIIIIINIWAVTPLSLQIVARKRM